MSEMNYQKPPHPLQQKRLQSIASWSEWKKLWDTEVHPERLIGLLHMGFDTRLDREDTVADRILFYLRVADGHASTIGTWEEDQQVFSLTAMGESVSWAEIRQKVAQKAFSILCQRVFRNEKDRYAARMSWYGALTKDSCVLLDHVLAFFLPRELPKGRFDPWICNLPGNTDGHGFATVSSFLTELCLCGWRFPNLRKYIPEENLLMEELTKRRPQFIRVLAALQRFDLIAKEGLELDDACCEMLERIALGTEVYLPTEPTWEKKHRLPKTLDEAVVGGSAAARCLLLHRMKLHEQERFDELRELASQQRDAAEKMEKLTAKKK
ncbi:MAG: hypothetical protein G01um1014106_409 [Parcubacteria group bacterium Gr01-1014_106]|nr:MAG: hypothetical protein G01um1014106_409 [Parcubacteria group bacterium Gr01-1014_106]